MLPLRHWLERALHVGGTGYDSALDAQYDVLQLPSQSDIAAVVTDRVMPPWKPARGVGPKLKHDQSLTPDEIATLEAWAAAGAPQGDPARTPPKPEFAKDWKLGPPDLVLEPAEEFSFPASGPDTYRCFVIPTNLPRDTYITAVDFRPGNPRSQWALARYLVGRAITESIGNSLFAIAVVILALAAVSEWVLDSTALAILLVVVAVFDLVLRWLASFVLSPADTATIADDLAILLVGLPDGPAAAPVAAPADSSARTA